MSCFCHLLVSYLQGLAGPPFADVGGHDPGLLDCCAAQELFSWNSVLVGFFSFGGIDRGWLNPRRTLSDQTFWTPQENNKKPLRGFKKLLRSSASP